MLEGEYEVLSLKSIGCEEELPENQETLEGNSLEKAQYVFDKYQISVFADDTGLEVSGLNGRPGVYSAMYAGPHRSDEDNMSKVLDELATQSDRAAKFRTIITLINSIETVQFEGTVEGTITETPSGEQGFGYDPIFIPVGFNETFAQMSCHEKNQISHRKRAVQKLVNFLKSDS